MGKDDLLLLKRNIGRRVCFELQYHSTGRQLDGLIVEGNKGGIYIANNYFGEKPRTVAKRATANKYAHLLNITENSIENFLQITILIDKGENKMNKYYRVFNSTSEGRPTKIHERKCDAIREADRLANIYKNDVFEVLECIGVCVVKKEVSFKEFN